MIRRVSHLTLALVAVAAILSPTALAGGGKPKKHHNGYTTCGNVSAVCVYHDSGGGLGGSRNKLSSQDTSKLQQFGGKDARSLAKLGASRAFGAGPADYGAAGSVGDVNSPSAFLAALDLGPGPIALFVTLLAGAGAFGLGRALRRRRAGL